MSDNVTEAKRKLKTLKEITKKKKSFKKKVRVCASCNWLFWEKEGKLADCPECSFPGSYVAYSVYESWLKVLFILIKQKFTGWRW